METNQVMVKMLLDRWYALIKNGDDFLAAVTDEQLEKEIVPGKNRGIYLLGHLVAVHDDMIRLLGFGDKLYPELFETFIKSPDKAVSDIPAAKELRACWGAQNEFMAKKIDSLTAEEWFSRHTAVSEEDFAKEPHRNKLNIMLTRSTHLAYHLGQLILLK